MDDSTSSGTGNSTSNSGTTEHWVDQRQPAMELLSDKIRHLETRIKRLNFLNNRLTHPLIRAIANKVDQNIPLDSEEAATWYVIVNSNIRYISRFKNVSIFNSTVNALEDEVNRNMNSIRKSYDRIQAYNQRIQTILSETQNSQTSQN